MYLRGLKRGRRREGEMSGERYKGLGLESWSIAEDFEAGV